MDIPAFTSQFEALDLSYTYDTRVIQIYEQNTLNPLPRDSSVWYWYLSFDFISIKSISTNSKTPTLIYSPLLHYPFRDETNAPSDAVTLIPTYIVNGVTYHNVACAHFDSTSGSNVIANDYFYFADSTGIIQMNIDHPLDSINRVWKLNNYQIVQLKQ